MRELNNKEIELTSGGIAPLLPAIVSGAISFGSNFAARGLTSYAFSRVGYVASAVGLGMALGEEEGS